MRIALLALLIPSVAFADSATEEAAARLVGAIKRHDATAIAARLNTPFKYDGAWFPDAACRKRFGAAGVLQTKERAAFARCMTKFVPQLSTRRSSERTNVVLTIEPGIELEVRLVDDTVRWIGPAGATDGTTAMLTAQTFEALRTQGTTLLDDAVRAELEPELVKANPASAWIRTCVDERGTATRKVAWAATPRTGEVFLRATSDWTFRAFELRDVPIATCSLSLLTYPASAAPSVETLPRVYESWPKAATYSFEDDLDVIAPSFVSSIATIQQSELVTLALAPLDPKPASAVQLANMARDRISQVNVCINTTGSVKNVVRMTQHPGDNPRAAKMWRWKFQPYLVNGVATEACALMRFIVSP